jgi:hypothetical protein
LGGDECDYKWARPIVFTASQHDFSCGNNMLKLKPALMGLVGAALMEYKQGSRNYFTGASPSHDLENEMKDVYAKVGAELAGLGKKKYSDGGACHEAWENDQLRAARLSGILARRPAAATSAPKAALTK